MARAEPDIELRYNAKALAEMLIRFRHDSEFVHLLKLQCARRAPLFSAEYEREGLLTIIASVISTRH